jgi:hypothetical protein
MQRRGGAGRWRPWRRERQQSCAATGMPCQRAAGRGRCQWRRRERLRARSRRHRPLVGGATGGGAGQRSGAQRLRPSMHPAALRSAPHSYMCDMSSAIAGCVHSSMARTVLQPALPSKVRNAVTVAYTVEGFTRRRACKVRTGVVGKPQHVFSTVRRAGDAAGGAVWRSDHQSRRCGTLGTVQARCGPA